MTDIGATPVVFSKSLFNNLDVIPDDFAIEVFTYQLRKKIEIKRFNININDRINSVSSWNTGILSKIKLSLLLIKSSFLIKIKERNK